MSIVQISDHNESIYAICERIDEAPEIFIEKKYKSRYSASVRNEKKQLKTFKERATMGPAQIKKPQPQDFLKKRNGRQSVPLDNLQDLKTKTRFSCGLSAKRPDVPIKDVVLCEQDEKLRHKGKNFILKNIEDVTKMKSFKPVRRIVVSVDGRRVEMGDGLLPKYIFSKKYGQIPKYVKEYHKEKDKSHQIETHFVEESVKCIDRNKVLAGLKENWVELQREFQKLPLLIDTIPKIIRKQKLENLINQLEKDILLIEKHSKIYVYDDK